MTGLILLNYTWQSPHCSKIWPFIWNYGASNCDYFHISGIRTLALESNLCLTESVVLPSRTKELAKGDNQNKLSIHCNHSGNVVKHVFYVMHTFLSLATCLSQSLYMKINKCMRHWLKSFIKTFNNHKLSSTSFCEASVI